MTDKEMPDEVWVYESDGQLYADTHGEGLAISAKNCTRTDLLDELKAELAFYKDCGNVSWKNRHFKNKETKEN